MGENICNWQGVSFKNTWLIQLNIKKKQCNQKIDRRSKQIVLQRRHTDGQQACEKMLNITNYWRNANQNHNDLTTSRWSEWPSWKSLHITCWRRCREKGTLLHCRWECKLVQPIWRTVWRLLKQLKIELPYDLAITLPEQTKTLIQKNMCTSIFTAALWTIAKTWKQTMCTSTDECIKKMWYNTHTHIHNGIWLSHNKEWNSAICSNMDEPSSVQSLSPVWLFATPCTAARQASLSITNSRSLLKLTLIESVMPSSHLILCRPLLLLPPVPPSIRVFSNESTLRMRWPKYWSFSFSISPSNEHTRLGAAKLSPATLYVPGQAAHQLNLSVLSAVQGW